MRIAAAIAEHHPEKLYKRNRAMLKMSHAQLHDYATKRKGHLAGGRRARMRKHRT